jgi:hypothetical protein
MKKIAILVLSCIEGPKDCGYALMDKCVRETWGSVKRNNIDIYYYYSQRLSEELEYTVNKDTIICNGAEEYHTIGKKTLCALEYLITKDYDYIFRTNSSSFIHLENLIKYIENAPSTKFYSGALIPYHTQSLSIEFATGSGYILSSDVARIIVNNKHIWDHNKPDDLELGIILKNNNIPLIVKDWLKITRLVDLKELEYLGDRFHIRCKIESSFDNHTQCEIFKSLYERVY